MPEPSAAGRSVTATLAPLWRPTPAQPIDVTKCPLLPHPQELRATGFEFRRALAAGRLPTTAGRGHPCATLEACEAGAPAIPFAGGGGR